MVLQSCNTLGLLMSPQTDGQGDSNPPLNFIRWVK